MAAKGLKYWTEKLSTQNMPVLGTVISELNKITGREDADVNQLAEVILRDPNLTSRVLKVANSVQYNYANTHINTVSRAIVHIGLKGVRAICISSMVMESLLKEKEKSRVLELVAQGFHAATQARNLVKAAQSGDEYAEEVFIGALLFNLGEMAFWMSEDIDPENEGLYSDSPKVRRVAMENILGTNFKAITLELAKQWKLGETLEQALYPSKNAALHVQAVITGERLSRAALYGWESPQLKKVLHEVAEYAGLPLQEALTRVKQGGDQAAELALSFGVPEACPLIPNSMEDFVLDRPKPKDRSMKGDAGLQLNILRDLSAATQEGLDVNTIFQMVLEGMHRGIGIERVCIAFIKGHKLAAKYMLGEGVEHWRSAFLLDVGPFTDNIFTYAMENRGTHWFRGKDAEASAGLYPPDLVTILGAQPSFVHVLEVEERKVAIFYADRSNLGGTFNEAQFESFKHFCQQAQMSLNLLSQTKPKRPPAKPGRFSS